MSETDPIPAVAGLDAVYLVRMLALAREREMSLGPAVAAVGDIPGLRRSRRFARAASGLDDLELLDALARAFERGGDMAAAGSLRALGRVGVPASGLRRLAEWFERRSAQQLQLLGAVFYPLTVMVTGVLAFSLLLHGVLLPVVLHGFDQLYEGFGVNLPWLTSLFLKAYGIPWLFLASPVSAVVYVAVVLGIAGWIVWFTMRFSNLGVSARLPLVGQFLRWEAAAGFSSTLAFLLEQEIPLPDAVRLAAGAVANPRLGRTLGALADGVESGGSLVESLRASQALPASVTWRLRSAYYRDRFEQELEAVAAASRIELDIWEHRVRSSVKVIVMLVAVVALLPVALAVIAMYMPMFGIISLF
jgi:type II secretory pathway component PulF